jgi:hypothetical protein
MTGDPFFGKVRKRWQEDAADTDGGGVTATHAAVADRRHVATHISGSGDAAALVTLESPASTILWRKRFAGAFTFSETLPLGSYVGDENAAMLLKISAATANSEANLAGYEIGG